MKYTQEYLHGYPTLMFRTVSLKNKSYVDLDKVAFAWGSEYVYVIDRSGTTIYNTQMNILTVASETKDGKYYRVPISAFKEAPKGSVSY